MQEVCCEDLNRYYVALDYSIMHFHAEKMKHVNDIVRDLWRQIYCGNDIDTIKIQTDKDTNLSGKFTKKTGKFWKVYINSVH